jgi:hypothetical protein
MGRRDEEKASNRTIPVAGCRGADEPYLTFLVT